MDDRYREGLADAAVKLVVARLWPHRPADEIAEVIGISPKEFRLAIVRARPTGKPLIAKTAMPKRERKTPATAPEGMKWCSRGTPPGMGHFVALEMMGINRFRSDGYSNLCKECCRVYFQERRAAQRRKKD